MKKNYSQKFLKPTLSYTSAIKNSSIEKPNPTNSPPKKAFSRKPAGGYQPPTRKRGQQSILQVDSTMQQTNFSQLLQKPTNLRFISCRSQSSLGNSFISKSNESFSFGNSLNDLNEQDFSCSRLLTDENVIPQICDRESSQRELFKRKNVINVKTPILNRKKVGYNERNDKSEDKQNTSIMTTKFARKLDNAEQQTKLQSSEFSDGSKSFFTPSSNITGKNYVQSSKNSSKQSLRKSNSSNSLIKKQPQNKCQQCEFHQRQLRQLTSKNQRLQRIITNKDEQLTSLNKKLQQNQRRTRQLEKKVKQIEKHDYERKFKLMEEELTESQQQCARIKETYSKTIQQLKYKNIENSTLKKFQVQCQSLQRKVQMLVAQRNELRQRLSSVKVTSRSSYMNYPTSFSKSKSKSPTNIIVHHSLHSESQKKRETFTSRNEEENDCEFEDEDWADNGNSFMTQNERFRKKKTFMCYDDSSESEIISLSEESNF